MFRVFPHSKKRLDWKHPGSGSHGGFRQNREQLLRGRGSLAASDETNAVRKGRIHQGAVSAELFQTPRHFGRWCS